MPVPYTVEKKDLGLGAGLFAVFKTNKGEWTIRLEEEKTPETVANFVGLATGQKEYIDPHTRDKSTKPFYDGTIFHRVIKDFIDFHGVFRIECDQAVYDQFIAEQEIPPAVDPGVAHTIAEATTVWRSAGKRATDVRAHREFDPERRGPDGDYFACFYDPTEKAMFLWVKANF